MLCCRLANRQYLRLLSISNTSIRSLTAIHSLQQKPLPPRLVIPETDLTESFLKGSGPGGQKINKTSSAVQIKHIPTGIVVKSQETRSREQNRKLARRILAEKLEEIEKGGESRTAIKAERARVKKASAAKKTRRKYKKLAEEKDGMEQDGREEGESKQERGGMGFEVNVGTSEIAQDDCERSVKK